MLKVGLRIDVDTYRGTRDGVPRLLALLDRYNIKGSFFFSVGPDNMGRHLWRLLKPRFLLKMLRSNATSLYGWDILLAGTAWPGKIIGNQLGNILRLAENQQHEIGLHAWDHHGWQAHAGDWPDKTLNHHIALGLQQMRSILGHQPDCSAAAGWRADERIVHLKEAYHFRYNSDCRGTSIFRPRLQDGSLGTLQIPVTLPTFDEVIGSQATPDTFNQYILSLIKPKQLNVYTIHAEVEGIVMAPLFEDLLQRAHRANIQFCPLGALLPDGYDFPEGRVQRAHISGREGWLGCQTGK